MYMCADGYDDVTNAALILHLNSRLYSVHLLIRLYSERSSYGLSLNISYPATRGSDGVLDLAV